jgi:hypothetical protein
MKDLNTIKSVVNNYMKVNIECKQRHHHTVIARWIYYKLANNFTDKGISKIGKYINRHHATVLYGLDKIEWELSHNKKLLQDYRALTSLCVKLFKVSDLESINELLDYHNDMIKKLETIKYNLENKFKNQEHGN